MNLRHTLHGMVIASVAIPLFYSGVLHAIHPFYFASQIAAYGIVPEVVATLTAFWSPYLLMLVSVLLVYSKTRRAALSVAVALFSIFAGFQLFALLQGKSIDCGCFGATPHVVSFQTISLPIVCLTISVVMLIYECQKNDATEFRARSHDVRD